MTLTEQVGNADVECIGDRPQLRDADLAISTLDEADDCAVESGSVGKFFLRKPSLLPKRTHPLTEGDQPKIMLIPTTLRHPSTVGANPQQFDCGSAALNLGWAPIERRSVLRESRA